MYPPRLDLTPSRDARLPLRFDDPEFLRALEDDAGSKDGDVERPLSRLLNVTRATDFDFSRLIAAEMVIYVAPTVSGKQSDDIYTAAQTRDGVDVAKLNSGRWALWTRGVAVSAEAERAMLGESLEALRQMCHPTAKIREQGFNALSREWRAALTCRLRVHIDQQDRPADRDPEKALTTED